ncbi:hypothetical protein ACFCQI_10770 [Rhodanobacter sp. FW102-FHT14D06]|uniref:Lipoprotein n=2 Tax=unclassified Rhodanobacter TaxID=2621553 RepID=A0AB74ULE2_9GAMM
MRNRHRILRTTHTYLGGVLLALALTGCSQGAPNQEQAAIPGAPSSATNVAAGEAESLKAPGELSTFSAYTPSIPPEGDNKQCALDDINGQPAANTKIFNADGSAALGGWAGDGQGHAAGRALLVLKGSTQSYSTPIHTSVQRADVAKALGSNAESNYGFEVNISFHEVAAGSYSMLVADPSNPANICDLHQTFTLH